MMAKEVADAETGTVTRRQRQTMEAAKKQMKEVKEIGRGRGSEYNRGRTVIRSRGRGRSIITAVKAKVANIEAKLSSEAEAET